MRFCIAISHILLDDTYKIGNKKSNDSSLKIKGIFLKLF